LPQATAATSGCRVAGGKLSKIIFHIVTYASIVPLGRLMWQATVLVVGLPLVANTIRAVNPQLRPLDPA
jgi:hypothetical protein